MKKVTLVAASVVGLATGSVLGQGVIYDNGGPDGTNGYSNATQNVFGARRTLLDDFVLGSDAVLTDFHWEHIWNTFPPGSGAGLQLMFLSDAGGAPGVPVATANITMYSEVGTGVTYFSRPGAASWVDFDPIPLGAGTYWFEATIVGPENNFWLTTSVKNSPCWVNYADFGGLQPGANVFGVDADINFYITPAPSALALLGLAGLAGSRRRRE
jgi:hypothetical protein